MHYKVGFLSEYALFDNKCRHVILNIKQHWFLHLKWQVKTYNLNICKNLHDLNNKPTIV